MEISRKLTLEEQCLYTVANDPIMRAPKYAGEAKAALTKYAEEAKAALMAKGWVGWTDPDDDTSIEGTFERPNYGPLDHAARLAIGGRPAGGAYELQVFDGPKWQAAAEYRIRVVLIETTIEEDEREFNRLCRGRRRLVVDQLVRPEAWQAAIRRAMEDYENDLL